MVQEMQDILASLSIEVPSLYDDVPGSDCFNESIKLSIAPPLATNEYTHEKAFGFLFEEEMKLVRQLYQKYTQGKKFMMDLYCARNCARSFPPLPSDCDQAQTFRYYMSIYTVLLPRIQKIKALSDFCSQAVVIFCDNIQKLTMQENPSHVIPDVLMEEMIRMIDLLFLLNQMCDMKTSIKNDFSFFKRAFQNVKEQLQDVDQLVKEMQIIQDFLGKTLHAKGSILDSLRLNVTNVKRFDQVILLLLRQCLWHLDKEMFLKPDEKCMYLRVLPCLLFILDKDGHLNRPLSFHPTAKKEIEAAIKYIRKFPVIPTFAEMSMKPAALFSSEFAIQGLNIDPKIAIQFNLVPLAKKIRLECQEFLPRLIYTANQAKPWVQRRHSPNGCDMEIISQLYEVILEGLKLMSTWKSHALFFLAIKYQSPLPDEKLRNLVGIIHTGTTTSSSPMTIEYERVTKYNYSKEEWTSLVQVISIIKSLAKIYIRYQAVFYPCLRLYMYHVIQVYSQHTLLPLLHRADKRKLVTIAKSLQEMRLCCGDWEDPSQVKTDFKKKRKERVFPNISNRFASVSRTQLIQLRALTNALYEKKSLASIGNASSSSSNSNGTTSNGNGMNGSHDGLDSSSGSGSHSASNPSGGSSSGGNGSNSSTGSNGASGGSLFGKFALFGKKDLSSSDLELLEKFYTKSFYFDFLLELEETVDELSDFGCVWFRELYLELSKSIQFPIEVSMPWMLCEHVLKTLSNAAATNNTSSTSCGSIAMENALQVMDIYNDAANFALYQLKQQYIFEEVQAEAKLCLDQFVFLLADQVYVHFKTLAAFSLLEPHYYEKLSESLACSSSNNSTGGGTTGGLTSGDIVKPSSSSSSSRQNVLTTFWRHFDAFDIVLGQKRLEMVGQKYDLNFLVRQHVHLKLQKDIDICIVKCVESRTNNGSGGSTAVFTSLAEYYTLVVRVLQRTHQFLSERMILEKFSLIQQEIQSAIGLGGSSNFIKQQELAGLVGSDRIIMQVYAQIFDDLCQHFAFNYHSRRFFKASLPIAFQNPRATKYSKHDLAGASAPENLTFAYGSHCRMAFDLLHRSQRGFIGASHVEALVALVSQVDEDCDNLEQSDGLVGIVQATIDFITQKIENVLGLCISALGKAIPPCPKFPKYMYKTEGCFGFFEGKFKHLVASEELKAQVFHCFREIGNALFFLFLLNDVVDSKRILASHLVSSFLLNPEQIQSNSEDLYYQKVVKTYEPKQTLLFQYALKQIQKHLHSSGLAQQWAAAVASDTNPPPTPGNIQNTSTFYHVWSALEFISCIPNGADANEAGSSSLASNNRAQFGDGFYFAGLTIVYLLEQKELYELWNFSQHVINVRTHEEVSVNSTTGTSNTTASTSTSSTSNNGPEYLSVGSLGKEMTEKALTFVANARQMRRLSQQLFTLLETTFPLSHRHSSRPPPPCRSYDPPLVS